MMNHPNRWFLSAVGVVALSTSLTIPVLSEQIKIRVKLSPRDSVEVVGFDSSGVQFVSLSDFANALRITFAINDTVKKLELKLPTQRVKVTARNPFIVITDLSTNSSSVYQLTGSIIIQNGKYFAPLMPFVACFSQLWTGGIGLDTTSLAVSVGSMNEAPEFDITGASIERKSNGYLITIHALRKFGDVEAWLKPDGWLFVTVANAKADTLALSRTKLFGAVRGLLTFQSPTSVQLTFKVAPDVVQAEVVNEAESHDLLIALRTLSAPEKEEIEKKRQQAIKEKLESFRNRSRFDVIVIDAGHGGKDPGALGVTKTREKDVTLAIALKLGKLIEQNLKDVKVVYTRKTDKFIELYRRGQIANEAGGKLFVSIHCNSMERKPSSAHGFEIYLLRPGKTEEAIEIAERENSPINMEDDKERYQKLTEENFILVTMAQSAYVRYSENFAETAAQAMAKNSTLKNSGVKQAGFYVLVGASMPNVLVETGYLSNKKEEKFLKSSKGQQKIAEALYKGIKEYKTIYEKALREGVQVGSER